jgi:D-serine deaminase-like pyridoxal phosphate-dependent protein
VTELYDQHAYLRLDADAALGPGDVVSLGISHPCTTLDKWRVLVVLDDDDVVIDIVHAFSRPPFFSCITTAVTMVR